MIVTAVLVVAGVATVLFPVGRPERGVEIVQARVETAAPPPAVAPTLDDRQLDAIAERVASRMKVWYSDTAAPVAKPVAEAEAPREVTAEQRAAAGRAGQIVDQALARRELAAEDVIALRQLGSRLQPATQDELRMRMIRALNRQELKLDPRAGLP
jgi:hypothetical protein